MNVTTEGTRHGAALRIGGCSAVELAREHGTPLYVYDEDGLRRHCRDYRTALAAAWPRTTVAYAVKAFGAAAMLRLAVEEGLDLDVASVGELATARHARVPGERITFHGVAKRPEELAAAVRAGVGTVAVDAVDEVADLIDACRSAGARQRVLLRVNPGTDVATDARYRTSGDETKFGLPIADGSARAALRAALASPSLIVEGVHFHLGSQLMTAGPYVDAMHRVAAFLDRDAQGWRPARIVLGGGMGVRYGPGAQAPTPAEWAAALVPPFAELLAPRCADGVSLGIEPGRSVVAAHGWTLYRVGAVKPRSTPGEATVVVDGGLSDNPRPLMYSATHEVLAAAAPAAAATLLAHVYGRHCETDLLFPAVALPGLRRGDVLAVRATGAYTHSMASNYNRFPRSAVVFARDGVSRVVVRRETAEDLLRAEVPA
ncbi:diaminopimelate decarboxylase [Dactylosporangium salmoneum]|uniref:Diaminopimelate decarboxylase n=1 Tax=Dactylosporangium salmoneum TaxID=53361 RepID=A0ABN3FY25_9ACTN